jgi:Family of unknown function (DUF6529)
MSQPTSGAPLPDPGFAATKVPGRRAARRSTSANTRLLGLVLIGAAVSLTLGVYGKLHEPAGVAVNLAGFSGPLEVKSWLASVAFLLALVQILSALVLYGRVPGIPSPPWVSALHRWSGRGAFLAAVPVAMQCLYALGFQTYDLRTLLHSILGCLFFGAFTVKMLVLTRSGLPGWALPVLGGTVFAVLVMLWLTSALWFFTTTGVKF